MADIYTGQVGNNWCPQMRLVVSLAAGNADHDLLNWTAYYVAHGYAAYTNGRARAWSINIDGQTQSGSYNINGQTGTVTLGSGQVRVNKQHAYRNIGVSCSMNIDVTWNGAYIGTATASGSHPIGEKQSYTVSYNANGGSGAPGNQTKWYGENLALSGTKPTRMGYTFAGWATSASGAVAYQPGGTYTGNGNLTLYAKWTAHTYTVSYNANGGSGAPGNQTKTYGVDLTLSSTKPTRTNYTFLGWGTSASSTTVAYNPGATYTGNTALSLYAIWKLAWKEPRITNLTATRCNSAGTLTEEGTYAKVSFSWATDKTISSIKIVCNGVTVNGSGSGTSGSVSVVVGANALSTEKDYPVNVTVTDQTGGVTISTTVSAMKYIQDFAPNGSVSFGKPANPSSKQFDVHIPTHIKSTLNVTGAATLNSGVTVKGTGCFTGSLTVAGSTVLTNADIVWGSTTNKDVNNNTWYWDYVKDTRTKRCVLFGKGSVISAMTAAYGPAWHNTEACTFPIKIPTIKSIVVSNEDISGGLIGIRSKLITSTGCQFYVWNFVSGTMPFWIHVIIEGLYE